MVPEARADGERALGGEGWAAGGRGRWEQERLGGVVPAPKALLEVSMPQLPVDARAHPALVAVPEVGLPARPDNSAIQLLLDARQLLLTAGAIDVAVPAVLAAEARCAEPEVVAGPLRPVLLDADPDGRRRRRRLRGRWRMHERPRSTIAR